MRVFIKSLNFEGIDEKIDAIVHVELKGKNQAYEITKDDNVSDLKIFDIDEPSTAIFLFTIFSVKPERRENCGTFEFALNDINGDHQLQNIGVLHVQFSPISEEKCSEYMIGDDCKKISSSEPNQNDNIDSTKQTENKTRKDRNHNLAELLNLDINKIHESALEEAKEKYQTILKLYAGPLSQNQKELEGNNMIVANKEDSICCD